MAYQPKSYRKFLATSVAAAIVATGAVPAASLAAEGNFKDIEGVKSWAGDAIAYLVEKGAIEGFGNGEFRPNEPLTRGQIAKVLAIALDLDIDKNAKTDFPDAKDHWASSYIKAIQDQLPGVINGFPDGTFRPEDPVTREQLAKIVAEAYDLEKDENADINFTDIGGWSKDFIETLASLGIVEGVGGGLFNPAGPVTRAQAAVFVHRTEVEEARKEVPKKPAAELQVVSVTAINAKEIKVEFNKKLNKSSAENRGNYKFFVNGSERTTADSITPFLQDDDKTVILQIKNGEELTNGSTYKVDIEKVVDADYKQMQEYKGTYAVFNDKEAPKLVKVEYKAGDVVLTFDEPLNADPTVKIDDQADVLTAKRHERAQGQLTAGKYEVRVTGLTDSMKKEGSHTIKVYSATDFAGNTAPLLSATYTVTNDTSKPQVEYIKAYSQDTFEIKFNTSISSVNSTNFEVKKGNYTFSTSDLTVTLVTGKENTYRVKVKSNDSNNPLYASGENSVNLSVTLKAIKSNNNVFMDETTLNVTLQKDKTPPQVQSANVNRVENIGGRDYLVIIFNEDLQNSVDTSKITVTKDGVLQTVDTTSTQVDPDDVKKLRIALDNVTTISSGTYNVQLGKGAVKDTSGNENVATTTTVVSTGSSGTKVQPVSITTSILNGKNRITINYGRKMANSAIDLANYKIDGVQLSSPLYSGTSIAFDNSDKEVVHIDLAKGNIVAENATIVFEISKEVKANSGAYIATNNDKVYTENITTLKDDVAPTIRSLEYVKEKSSDNSTDIIKVTFSENIKIDSTANILDDFEIKVGGTKVAYDAVVNTSDKKELLIKLNTEVNTAQTATLQIVTDTTKNPKVAIVDNSTLENRLEATDNIYTISATIVDKDTWRFNDTRQNRS